MLFDSTQLVALVAGVIGLVAIAIGGIMFARDRTARRAKPGMNAVRFLAIGAVGCIANVFLHNEVTGIVLGIALAAFVADRGNRP